jgi:hypothetical protein
MKKPPTFARALVRSLIAFTGLLGAAVIVAATTSNASAGQPARTSAQATPQAAWLADPFLAAED